MSISYNYGLVFLSLILAVTASYAALSIASRVPYVERKMLWLWIAGGSTSMGLAIWSMHFVGMLAFHIDIPLAYDIPLTGLSILYAIAATVVALLVVRVEHHVLTAQIIATLCMGTGIAAMHYTGMAALKIMPGIIYNRYLFTLSLIIAYAASFIALQLFFTQAQHHNNSFQLYNQKRLYASFLMGIAIAGMHYTGMQAAIFSPDSICGAIGSGFDSGVISIMIIFGVMLIILMTLLILLLDSKFSDNRRLAESKNLFRKVLNSAPQGMLLIDQHGLIQQVNRSMLELSGFTLAELVGHPIELLVPQHIRSRHAGLREKFFHQLDSRFELKSNNLASVRKDGSEYPVEVSLTPMQTANIRYILVTLVDISQRKILEQELSQRQNDLIDANQRIMLATDSAEIGIWEYNLIDQSMIWDDWMYRLYGFQPNNQPLTYQDWEKRVYPEDVENMRSQIKQAVNGTKPLDTSFRILVDDDQLHWIKAYGTLITDESGKPVRMTGINQDITDKILDQELIWQQANFDPLTSLPNRKLFHELLDQEIKTAHRYQESVWMLFLDLDGFKEINDTLGHHAGDELLIQVANRIQSELREADIVARLGGDEFVVIISHTEDNSLIDLVASKLIDSVAQSYTLGSSVVHISTSIGIANYPHDAGNADDLLKYADQSMYVSKKGGKNRISYFTPEFQELALKRIQITADLHRAIAHSEFELYYQPIIDLSSGRIHKAEALIRWKHPDKGMMSPDTFIPIAEETGIICDIGSMVFDLALQQIQTWLPQLDDEFQLSINMSPFQLKIAPEKYQDWTQKLNQYSVSGKQIVIEITEGLLLKSDKLVSDRLQQYRRAGVEIAIDDFGTGYSSLAYIKEFNIDYLKIDQSFTRNLFPGSKELALSETIVVMAHKLGLQVIAEGVETQPQLDLLTAMNCDYGQGYLFSKPLPANEFAQSFITGEIQPNR